MGTWDFVVSNRLRTLALALVVAVCTSYPTRHSIAGGSPPEHSPAKPEKLAASLYDLDSNWIDQNGRPFKWRDGTVQWTVVSMVYTSCQSSCPLITQKMQALDRKLPADLSGRVRFLLFSFDPKRDTPSVLKTFATKRHLDLSRWTLLTASEEDARALATALDFRFKSLANGEYSHSNQITLINDQGNIVMQTSDLQTAPQLLMDRVVQANPK